MKKFEIKKILVPTDFSETATAALNQAVFMAKAAKAHLEILYVIEPEMNFSANIPMPQSENYYESLNENLLVKLKKIAEDIKNKNSIEVSYQTKYNGVYKNVCAVATDNDFDLIIMGTHGNSGVSEFFAGSNASKVIAHAECPVITIQKSYDKNFKNIILPIRSDVDSRQKVDYVYEIAKLFSSTVHITGFAKEGDDTELTTVQQYVNQVDDYLTKLNILCTNTIISGSNFTKEIIEHATKNNADLIAVMNDTSFSFEHLIKGPYAKQLVNHSLIPILSVPISVNSDSTYYSPYLSGTMPGD